MPFLNYGGVLADDRDAADALLQHAVEARRRPEAPPRTAAHRTVLLSLTPKRHKVAMELALSDSVDAEWDGLDRKIRNQVRKAEKHGLEAVSGGAELVGEFYEVFARNMRDLGTPVWDVDSSSRCSRPSPLKRASSSCVPRAGRRRHRWCIGARRHPGAVGVGDREFNPLCANVFLYWHMVREAIERRFRTSTSRRSTPGEGTFHFKKQWGENRASWSGECWTAEGPGIARAEHKESAV